MMGLRVNLPSQNRVATVFVAPDGASLVIDDEMVARARTTPDGRFVKAVDCSDEVIRAHLDRAINGPPHEPPAQVTKEMLVAGQSQANAPNTAPNDDLFTRVYRAMHAHSPKERT